MKLKSKRTEMKFAALNRTLTIILAGGQGSRLYPLTVHRAKPAVPFAGKYRIIDFALSNCLNSGLRKIAVLTQYRSYSLDNHLRYAWNIFNYELQEFIEIIPPQHSSIESWYQGTADAIYKNINLIEEWNPEYILVLSGDHIYKMDYQRLLDFHIKKKADLTVASIEYTKDEASDFGILEVNEESKIKGFQEKPENPKCIPGKPDKALASMGIYIFSIKPMIKALIQDAKEKSAHDFGKNIIPEMIKKNYNVYAYNFIDKETNSPAYWQDVGTLDAYYASQMAILKSDPKIDLYDTEWPLRTIQPQFPPTKIVHSENGSPTTIIDSVVSSGSLLVGCYIKNCMLSPNIVIHENASIENSIIFEGVKIGKNVKIRNTIIDKNVEIPDNTIIGYDLNSDKTRFVVSDKGLRIIPSNTIF